MKSKVIYRVKVFVTYIIIAMIVLFFSKDIISSFMIYNNLYGNYTKVFLEVTQSIEDY